MSHSNSSTERHTGEGQCLCGAVSFVTDSMSHEVGACHCGTCRQWGGGPYLATRCGSAVEFKGEESIAVYNSSEWAERGFCKACGTHLFYRLKATQEHFMPIGLFSDDTTCVLHHQVFIDKKPNFYRFANETHDMTEADIFAMYAPPAD